MMLHNIEQITQKLLDKEKQNFTLVADEESQAFEMITRSVQLDTKQKWKHINTFQNTSQQTAALQLAT